MTKDMDLAVGESEENEQILLTTPKFSVVRLQPEGRADMGRTIIRHPGAVVILPLLGDERVCLIRNRRVSVCQTLLELPAGTCEPNESIEETAQRELTEETGFIAGQIEHVHSYYASPGIMDEQMHFFIAKDLVASKKNLMADEEIENEIMTLDQAYQLVKNQSIVDAKTINGLLYYRNFIAVTA